MDKRVFVAKMALLLFIGTSLIVIGMVFFLGATESLALGYLISLAIIETINIVIAILEEPIIKWLM